MNRTRSDSTTVAASDVSETNTSTGGVIPVAFTNAPYSSWVSDMSDHSGGGRVNKPCLHNQCETSANFFVDWHPIDATLAPSPNKRYDGVRIAHYGSYYTPGPLLDENYIPCSARTFDDYGDCVFQAYNQFINSYRGLDLAQSICEAGETPQLFSIWSRRKGLSSNLVSGFLNYSFGWKPVINDLYGIASELRRFPKLVRERLNKTTVVVKHYRFQFDDTVSGLNNTHYDNTYGPYTWNRSFFKVRDTDKRRIIVVTIRAKSKPKLDGPGQALLEKLGRYGLIPSIATIWSITRLSFVVDWFYNIGGAIENLQGSLTHDISDVTYCLTDTRTRLLTGYTNVNGSGEETAVTFYKQKSFKRIIPLNRPILPVIRLPKRPMQYVLLGLIALVSTKGGKKILWTADRYESSFKKTLRKFEFRLNQSLNKHKILGH